MKKLKLILIIVLGLGLSVHNSFAQKPSKEATWNWLLNEGNRLLKKRNTGDTERYFERSGETLKFVTLYDNSHISLPNKQPWIIFIEPGKILLNQVLVRDSGIYMKYSENSVRNDIYHTSGLTYETEYKGSFEIQLDKEDIIRVQKAIINLAEHYGAIAYNADDF